MKESEIKQQYRIEFEPLVIGTPDKLFLGVFGKAGTGKTRIMATAPGLGVIPLQRKTRPTVEQVLKELYPNRKVWWPKNADEFYKYKNPMEMSMMSASESKDFYRALVDKVKYACWSLLDHPGVKTIGIDSGYTLYQMIVAAHYGRSSKFSELRIAWEPPNTEMRTLLESLQTKHIVFTTESKEAWSGTGKGSASLGYDDPAGYKQLGYESNVLVETKYSVADGFSLDVRMCQDRAALQGEEGQRLLAGEMVEFKYLACQLRPDTRPEDWED
jgi:hypothetical protein